MTRLSLGCFNSSSIFHITLREELFSLPKKKQPKLNLVTVGRDSSFPSPDPFSEIQCNKFRSQNAPHSWVTVRDCDLLRDCVAEWRLMPSKPNQRSRVLIYLLKKNKPTSGQRNKLDSRTKYLDKPVRKPKEIETCDKSGVF